MIIKCLWLRFLVCYFFIIIGPPLMIALAPIFTLIFGPCFFSREIFYDIPYISRFEN